MSEWADDETGCHWERIDAPKARKEHTCDACDRTIRAGEHYALHRLGRGGWDPAIHAVKRCVACQRIWAHLDERLEAERERRRAAGEPAYMLPDYINLRLDCGHEYADVWGEDPPPEILALAFGSGEDLR